MGQSRFLPLGPLAPVRWGLGCCEASIDIAPLISTPMAEKRNEGAEMGPPPPDPAWQEEAAWA
jgi:hypothetical protein